MYQCGYCKKLFRTEDEAWHCCASYQEVYVCSGCEQDYWDADVAKKCCDEPYDDRYQCDLCLCIYWDCDDAEKCKCHTPVKVDYNICRWCGHVDKTGSCCPDLPRFIPASIGQLDLFTGERKNS